MQSYVLSFTLIPPKFPNSGTKVVIDSLSSQSQAVLLAST